ATSARTTFLDLCISIIAPSLRTKATLFPYTTLFRSPGDMGFHQRETADRMIVQRWVLQRIQQCLAHIGSCSEPDTAECAEKPSRSEEHTSELQSRENLVCRLLLEKKK